MQAVILVGGEGKRLRPLTSTVPKPVVPLVDRPFIAFMLEWLRQHEIDDVIMSCGFLATSVRNVLGDGSALGIRLRFVEEPDPRGTAGALKFSEMMMQGGLLLLCGDVLSNIGFVRTIAPPHLNVPIEREVWPLLIGQGLYGFPSESYWLDIGTPERYLKATFDIIEGNVETAVKARLGDDWLAIDE